MSFDSSHHPFLPETTLVIFNPACGYLRTQQRGRRVIRLLKEHNYLVTRTARVGHSTELARDAVRAGKTGVVVVGGDGTLCEAIAGLSPDIALAYYPAGSGNNFAFNLHLPQKPEAWMQLLESGFTRPMRFGLCNGQPFATVASVGFDASLVRITPGKLKRHLSKGAYAVAFWPHYFRYQPPQFELRIDGRAWNQGNVLGVIVGRGRNYGGRHPILPACDPGAGQLSYLVMTGRYKRNIPRYAIGMLLDNLPKMTGTTTGTARTIEVATRPVSDVQLDGNLYGSNPVTFSVDPVVRRILAP